MEEKRELGLTRVEENASSTTSIITSDTTKNKAEEEIKKEEEKKLSTSRLFVLFIILDIILGLFLIAELILLFVNFFSR